MKHLNTKDSHKLTWNDTVTTSESLSLYFFHKANVII